MVSKELQKRQPPQTKPRDQSPRVPHNDVDAIGRRHDFIACNVAAATNATLRTTPPAQTVSNFRTSPPAEAGMHANGHNSGT
jgi:hypothetical protein